MLRRQCGNTTTEKHKMCSRCGASFGDYLPASVPEADKALEQNKWGSRGMPSPQVNEYRTSIKKATRKRRHALILIICSILAVSVAIMVPVLVEKSLADRYSAAFELMDSNQYEDAKFAFSELRNYRESAEMVKECQAGIDYTAAVNLMDAGDYVQALSMFITLKDYSNSAAKEIECRHAIEYNAAMELMDAGNYKSARNAFAALDGYRDAVELSNECQNHIDYNKAEELLKARDFEAAQVIFAKLDNFKDAALKADECANNISYIAAENAFNEGKYYTAYAAFSGLRGFKDSMERCKACIQKAPQNGEFYHNPDFGKKVSFTFKNEDSQRSACVKAYTEDNILVSVIFIGPNSKATIKLPTGRFRFKEAVGLNWFGEKEFFGDSGIYSVMQFEDGELAKLSSSKVYTLTLMLKDGTGNVGGSAETMSGF